MLSLAVLSKPVQNRNASEALWWNVTRRKVVLFSAALFALGSSGTSSENDSSRADGSLGLGR